MRTFRSIYRSLALLLLLIAAVIDGQVRKLLFGLTVGPAGAVWVSRWCRRLLSVSGIRLTVEGPLPTVVNSSLALVSNHLSYLDILVYSAIQPSIMVAKKEVRSWPLIGWITAQAGTVYVERADHKGGRTQTHAEVNQQMAEAFKSQLPVLFYPEGTTTDGAHVLPFRRGLFHSILKDQVALKTSAIAYSLDVFNPDATLEQDVCYWGDMEFMPHLFRCLGLQGMHAHVVFSPHTVAGQERFSLAANAREAVLELYQGIAETALEPVLSHARTRNDSSDDPYGLSEHWPDGLVTVEHTRS